MLVKVLIIVITAYISWEIIEHLLLPLLGRIFWKGKRQLLFSRPPFGPSRKTAS